MRGEPEKLPPPFGVIEEVNTLGLKVTALKTAMELDVFTTIASGHQGLEEIAQATGGCDRQFLPGQGPDVF